MLGVNRSCVIVLGVNRSCVIVLGVNRSCVIVLGVNRSCGPEGRQWWNRLALFWFLTWPSRKKGLFWQQTQLVCVSLVYFLANMFYLCSLKSFQHQELCLHWHLLHAMVCFSQLALSTIETF